MTETPPEKPWIGRAAIAVGVTAMICGFGLAIWHAYFWLKHGAAADYTTTALFADVGLGHPQVSWRGVQRVIDWIMASQAAYVLLFGGMGLAVLGANAIENYDKRLREFNHGAWEREQAKIRGSEQTSATE